MQTTYLNAESVENENELKMRIAKRCRQIYEPNPWQLLNIKFMTDNHLFYLQSGWPNGSESDGEDDGCRPNAV